MENTIGYGENLMTIDTSAIRLRACAICPYLAAALYNMTLIVIDRDDKEKLAAMPSMGVDRWWRCYINPNFAETIGVKITANIFIHEVYHLISDHATRATKKQINNNHFVLWNIACDMAINQDLKRMNLTLPDDVFYPSTINEKDGELAEYYYDKLLENATEIPADFIYEGSGVTGKEEEWELGDNGEKHEKISKEKGNILRRKVAQDIKEHSKSRGNIPAGLKRWADEILDPKIDWLTKFMSALYGQISKKAGMVDFTYSRPSRRASCCAPIIFPKMVQPIPNVAILLDTSGSMSDRDLADSLAEVKGAIDALGNPVTVYSADTEVHPHQNIWNIEDINLVGGGGTHMGRAIEQVAEDSSPDILIVITDGYTPWLDVKPDNLKSIIALFTNKGHEDELPDFIEGITIDA